MISDVLDSLPEGIRFGFGMEMDVIRLRPRLQIFELHIVSVGDRGRIDPGQALQTAARDDADLVLVHDPEAEQKFIAASDGIDRRQIAWNDFIVSGPAPARRVSPAPTMRSRR